MGQKSQKTQQPVTISRDASLLCNMQINTTQYIHGFWKLVLNPRLVLIGLMMLLSASLKVFTDAGTKGWFNEDITEGITITPWQQEPFSFMTVYTHSVDLTDRSTVDSNTFVCANTTVKAIKKTNANTNILLHDSQGKQATKRFVVSIWDLENDVLSYVWDWE